MKEERGKRKEERERTRKRKGKEEGGKAILESKDKHNVTAQKNEIYFD